MGKSVLSYPTESQPDSAPHSGLEGTRWEPKGSRFPFREASTIWVALDEESSRKALRLLLESAGYRVVEVDSNERLLREINSDVNVVVTNLDGARPSGRECIQYFKKHCPNLLVILVSRFGETPEVVSALQEGAFECFTRSCHPDLLLAKVRDAVRLSCLAKENRHLRHQIEYPTAEVQLAGHSSVMTSMKQQCETFARLGSNVLLAGPRGVGKKTIARWIHARSSMALQPLVVFHGGSIANDVVLERLFGPRGREPQQGLFGLAEGGTLLLDQIDSLSLKVQRKLMSYLRDWKLQASLSDVVPRLRIISTTTQDLSLLCQQGRFLEELLFQIDILSLRIPPLKEHLDDIPAIADLLLERIARKWESLPVMLCGEAYEALQHYNWPGNIRELEVVLELAGERCENRTITRSDLAHVSQLSGADSSDSDGCLGLAGLSLSEIECRAILETLRVCGGNKAAAARRLGVNEKTIYNKIKRYHLREKF